MSRIPHTAVKRVMKEDPGVVAVSNQAVQYMATSVHLFLNHFAEQALASAQLEDTNKTNNKRIAYKDFANAVANNEELQFLGPLVPKTVPFKSVFRKRMDAHADADVLTPKKDLESSKKAA